MNPLVETFVAQSNNYWGESTEYKFLSSIDTIADATEITADGERFVKSTFSVIAHAYLLPEYINSVVTDTKATMEKKMTTSRVVFGFEGDATDKQIKK